MQSSFLSVKPTTGCNAFAFQFYFTPNCIFAVGARVIMACRDMERAQAAVKEVTELSGNENVVCMKLDLADSKSIKEFAEAINKGKRLCPTNKLIQLFQSCTVITLLCVTAVCLLQESLNSTSSSTMLV